MSDPSAADFKSDITGIVQEAFPIDLWSGMTILVAVSGGADSVALLRVLSELCTCNSTIVVAHLDHETRGDESAGDARFVRELAKQLGVRCISERRSAYTRSKLTDEASLRAVRYRFLVETANRTGSRYLATAHHADDVAETFLINMIRGSGLKGLTGIPTYRSLPPVTSKSQREQNDLLKSVEESLCETGSETVLVRPLLRATRQQIENYLRFLGQSYRTDTSNQSHDYLRNEIRAKLIPLIDQIGGRRFNRSFVEGTIQLTSNLRETDSLVDDLATTASEELKLDRSGQHLEIPIAFFDDHPWLIVQRSLVIAFKKLDWSVSKMTSSHWYQIREFATNAKERIAISNQVRVDEKMLPNRLQLVSNQSSIAIRMHAGKE